MKHLRWTSTRFHVVLLSLYIMGTLLSAYFMRKIGIDLQSDPRHPKEIFFWLSPQFAAIQTGNLILLWGGILSFIAGVFVPKDKWGKEIGNLLINKIGAITVSILSTYIFERICINSTNTNFSDNLSHSLHMCFAMLMFLWFWSLLGYGLKLSFSKKYVALCVGILIQIAELYVIIRHTPQLEIYLPTSLSRQLIVSQFPFWDPTSWAANPNAFAFANSPMTVDQNYRLVSVTYVWVTVFLFWYLFLSFIFPLVKYFAQKQNTFKNPKMEG